MTLTEADPRWTTASEIWSRFGDLTRFVSSAEIAFEREAVLWRTTDLVKADSVQIRQVRGDGKGEYRAVIGEHTEAVSELGTLHGLVLLGYCSLAEEISRLALGSQKLTGGIEQWGAAALATHDQSFDEMKGGLAGMVGTFVVRNAVAHGSTSWSKRMWDRVRKAGGNPPTVGTPIDPSTALTEGRPLIKNFMRCTGMTVV